MVTTEGLFPSRDITDKHLHCSLNNEINTSHDVFQWLFRISRNWKEIASLIPAMKVDLRTQTDLDDTAGSKRNGAGVGPIYHPDCHGDNGFRLRERFCTAAASLAASMNLSIEKIGVLYDQVVDIGTFKLGDTIKRQTFVSTLSSDKQSEDVELAFPRPLLGRGQLLILVRQLEPGDVTTLIDAGYRFASVSQVGRNIAGAMQISQTALDAHVLGLRDYVRDLGNLKKAGTWLSCFAIVPKINGGGFDVAVRSDCRDQLPDVQLLSDEPLQWQIDFLRQMHGRSSQACFAFLENGDEHETGRTPREKVFANVLVKALSTLQSQMPAQWFKEARFYGKPVLAQYTQPLQNGSAATVLYAFTVCGDIHTSVEACHGISKAPLSFFSARHRCVNGSPNNQLFVQRVHQEFVPLFSLASTRVPCLRRPGASACQGPSQYQRFAADGRCGRAETILQTLISLSMHHGSSARVAKVPHTESSRISSWAAFSSTARPL